MKNPLAEISIFIRDDEDLGPFPATRMYRGIVAGYVFGCIIVVAWLKYLVVPGQFVTAFIVVAATLLVSFVGYDAIWGDKVWRKARRNRKI